jgi:hypothetical protein
MVPGPQVNNYPTLLAENVSLHHTRKPNPLLILLLLLFLFFSSRLNTVVLLLSVEGEADTTAQATHTPTHTHTRYSRADRRSREVLEDALRGHPFPTVSGGPERVVVWKFGTGGGVSEPRTREAIATKGVRKSTHLCSLKQKQM